VKRCTPLTLNQTVKTQAIRLADVALVGPLMIWGGVKTANENPVPGMTLLLFGIGTIIYNASNFISIERKRAWGYC
jgi:hypothetical protein